MSSANSTLMEEGFVLLDTKAAMAELNVSRTMFWKLRKEDDFPKEIHISKRRIGWLQSELQEWILNQRVKMENIG